MENKYQYSPISEDEMSIIDQKKHHIIVGFDGFIDTIIHPVHIRQSSESWSRMENLHTFSERIQQASNKSTNIEIVRHSILPGGNAPLFAQAAANLNIDIDLIATLLSSQDWISIDPIFSPLTSYLNIHTTPFHIPGMTDAYEFHDGKVLFGNMNGIDSITLEKLFQSIPKEILISKIQQTDAIVTLNWTMMPLVQDFWRWLIDIFSQERHLFLSSKKPFLFVDFSDPKKRPLSHFKEAFSLLKRCAKIGFDVLISLNTSEAHQSLITLNDEYKKKEQQDHIISMISEIHTLFPEARAIIGHSHTTACASWRDKNENVVQSSYKVPFLEKPYATTGAGDAFNGGFLSALLYYNCYEQALLWGIATSGIWVRTRTSATQKKIQEFLQNELL